MLLWIFLGIYLVVLAALTIYSYKKTKVYEDFAIAGGHIGPYMLGFATAATAASTALFMGTPAWGYLAGMTVLWYGIAIFAACFISFMIIIKQFSGMSGVKKSLTLPDWLGDRYNSNLIKVIVGVICFANVFYVAGQFSGAGFIFEVATDLGYEVGIILAVVVVVIYISLGGSRTDIYTDYFQGVLMSVIALLVGLSIFWVFDGGLTEMITTLGDKDPNLLSATNPAVPVFKGPIDIISIFIFYLTFSFSPQLINKIMMLDKPEVNSRKFVATYGIVLFIFTLMIFGGIAARAFMPMGTLENPNMAIPLYLEIAFPAAVATLFLVIILCAAMSTVDGLFVVFATFVSNDIYRKIIVKKRIEKDPNYDARDIERKSFRISQVVVVIVGIVSILLVLDPPEIVTAMVVVGINAIVASCSGPLLFGMFSKRPSKEAALLSIIVGFVAYLVAEFSGITESIHTSGAIAVVINIVVMAVATYAFKAMPQEEAKGFFKAGAPDKG